MSTTQVSEFIENFDVLSLDDKEFLMDIIEKNYIETKRNELIQRVAEAKQNYIDGNVKTGSIKDLFKDLEDD